MPFFDVQTHRPVRKWLLSCGLFWLMQLGISRSACAETASLLSENHNAAVTPAPVQMPPVDEFIATSDPAFDMRPVDLHAISQGTGLPAAGVPARDGWFVERNDKPLRFASDARWRIDDWQPARRRSIRLPASEPQVCVSPSEPWTLQVMPTGLLYRSYLAGAKEPRFATYWNSDSEQGSLWDVALGGRLGLLRYGTRDPLRPEGWQVDMEGGIHARLDPYSNSNALYSVDFRIGIPVTWARGPWQFKTGYYHISAHLGDEFLLMNLNARRLNYVRDSALLALGYFCTERLRLYGEMGYALGVSDGAKPLEFQLGADWAPARDTGLRGAPFAAVNGHLREEVDFGGNLVLQTGWAWRSTPRGSLSRIGVQYYRGKSDQYEYFDRSEERFGWGIWVDY